jgi:hypothetical protein
MSRIPERHIAVADPPQSARLVAPNRESGQLRIALLHNDLRTINESPEYPKRVGAKLAFRGVAGRSQWICPSSDPDTQLPRPMTGSLL